LRKIAFIGMALVLALGVMGAGFALWSDSLFIAGTIETGSIGLVWTVDLPPTDNEAPDKDVSSADSWIDAAGILHITIVNAYPCITYTIPFDLHGIGSVPVHTAMTLISEPCPWVQIPNLSGMQIHEGDVWEGEIVIHLDNTALENMTYYFTVQLDYWQYNEAPGQLPFFVGP